MIARVRARAVPPQSAERSAGRSPGFDLFGTLAKPGGSTAAVLEIPREAGMSVSDL